MLTRLLLVMLRPEFGQILLILGIFRGLLVFCKFGIVLFLGGGCLAFTSFPRVRGESLPSFPNEFSDLGEAELLTLE